MFRALRDTGMKMWRKNNIFLYFHFQITNIGDFSMEYFLLKKILQKEETYKT